MFTLLAIAIAAGVTLWSQHNYRKETLRLRAFEPPEAFTGKRIRESIVFIRQDSMLIVGLLGVILLMLGIIADRIH